MVQLNNVETTKVFRRPKPRRTPSNERSNPAALRKIDARIAKIAPIPSPIVFPETNIIKVSVKAEADYKLKLLDLLSGDLLPYSEARKALNKVIGYLFPGKDLGKTSIPNLEYILESMAEVDNDDNMLVKDADTNRMHFERIGYQEKEGGYEIVDGGVAVRFDLGMKGKERMASEMRISREAFEVLSELRKALILMNFTRSVEVAAARPSEEEIPTEVYEGAPTRLYETKVYAPQNRPAGENRRSEVTVNMRVGKLSKEKLSARLVNLFSSLIKKIKAWLDRPPLMEETFVCDMERNISEWNQILRGEGPTFKMKKGRPPFGKGDVIQGKYKIVKIIAQGGQAWVYEATNPEGREVAVKVMIKNGEETSDKLLKAEAGAVCKLSGSNNFVTFVDEGVDQDNPFYVMERLQGDTLYRYLIPGKGLPIEDTISLIMAVAHGLRDAHEKDVIHADVSTENTWITPEGRVLLIDPLGPIFPHLKPGEVAGKKLYMAPEQALGRGISFASDQYSLGILFYRLLTGRLPFDNAETRIDRLSQGIEEKLPDSPLIPAEYRVPLAKLTAFKPEDRYPEIDDFIVDMKKTRKDFKPAKS